MAKNLKSDLILGINLFLRNAVSSDALFIFSLRTNPKKGKYLSYTNMDIEHQIAWLANYEKSDNQAYFIVCSLQGERLGCIRIYDPLGVNYSWGSWIMIDGLPPSFALEVVALILSYGKSLGFQTASVQVRKDNESVLKFHQNFLGAQLMGSDEKNYILFYSQDLIDKNLKKLSKFLSTNISL